MRLDECQIANALIEDGISPHMSACLNQSQCLNNGETGTRNRTARAMRAIHIAILNNVVYDVLPMTSGAVRPLLCR
jgi:hypothetical protein